MINLNRPNIGLNSRVMQVLIKQVIFNEMPEFNNMAFRPYTANPNTQEATNEVLNKLEEQARGFERFSPATIGNVVNNVINVSGTATGLIAIDNGWQTKRYTFSMMVDVALSSGGVITYMVNGFTDTNEIIIHPTNVLISPNIVLHITNITQGHVRNNINGSSGLVVTGSDQIITKNQYLLDPVATGNEFRSQRPVDIINTISSNMFRDEHADAIFIDTSTAITSPQVGNRLNNIPTNYAANLFNSYIEATENNEGFTGETYFPTPQELSTTKSVNENYISDNKFLMFLQSNASNPHYLDYKTSFRWADIMAVDNTIMDRVHVNRSMDRLSFLPSNGLMTADTATRSDLTGQIAAVLATSIPALLNKCQLISASFIANNNLGMHQVTMQNASSFNPQEAKKFSIMFQNMLPSFILDNLFNSIGVSYELMVFCHSYTETFIKLSINGSAPVDFLFPTYADALVTPLVTNNHNTIDTLSKTVNHLAQEMTEFTKIKKDSVIQNFTGNNTGFHHNSF